MAQIKKCGLGFDSFPENCVRRGTREGFSFNVLLVGPTGIGKTTLLDSLYEHKFPDTSTQTHDMKQVDLNVQTFNLSTISTRIKLTVVETKGFDDQLDKSDCHQPIVNYIDEQFESYLQEDLIVSRPNYMYSGDPRIHCCIYMISPTRQGLKTVDLITMKNLHNKVCLIPVIARADALTKSERELYKSKIMSDIVKNNIQIYHFPTNDLESSKPGANINESLPFAVIASQEFSNLNGKKVRVRQYPWGEAQIEDETHSDFCKLRMALRDNMVALVDATKNLHYENYRQARLQGDFLSP